MVHKCRAPDLEKVAPNDARLEFWWMPKSLTASESGRALSKKRHTLQCATSYDLCNFFTLLQKEPSYPSNFPKKNQSIDKHFATVWDGSPPPFFLVRVTCKLIYITLFVELAPELIIMMMINVYIFCLP